MPSEISFELDDDDEDDRSTSQSSSSSSSLDSNVDDDDSREILLGQSQFRKNPHSTSRCWSCFVRFRHGIGSYYTTHEHPLLGIVVCSVCHDAAEELEARMLSSRGGGDDERCCSWCALPLSSLDPPFPPLADGLPNDLFLCDSCPRSFCQKCVVVSRGGDEEALRYVRANADGEEGWSCCVCVETEFLGRLREGYVRLLNDGGGGDSNNRRRGGEENESEESNDDEGRDEEKDERIARLIDELRETELRYALAQRSLEEEALRIKRREIEAELETMEKKKRRSASTNASLSSEVEREVHNYQMLWMDNSERLQETIGKLLNELEDEGINVLDVYRFFEEEEKSGDGRRSEEEEVLEWKEEADRALDQRDIKEGFNKGEFRGATGYKAKDSKIYKLEPEDLNPACLNEIEDINTTEGAISQMNRLKSHQEASNQWGSKTGITEDDIEMFEKKCTKFEELTLGSKIDLKALERNYIKDKDDALLDRKEGVTMTIRRKNGNGRVVRRIASVRSVILQNQKETNSSRLMGDSNEYTPCLPVAQERRSGESAAAWAPKPKKRAQLLHSSSSLSAHVTPSMKGILIGDDVEFLNSDIVLPVKQCADKISICKPLASVLMDHQIEGVKFCWTRICENLVEGRDGEVRGAILAHSMGVGKSIQTISLLHTLLTHPSLVHSSASMNGSTRKRIIHKALLIAPVNTLANWESEFNKWIGVSSGKQLPFIRFYSWDQKVNKEKLINEWHEYGGVLCTSSGRYSSTASKLFKKDGLSKEGKTNSSENDNDMLYRTLVNPGPDIIVLDEAHTMLKNSTSSIFKVLNNLGTKHRLSLTGTPLQNNLLEYFRMANWTKPGYLGTEISFTYKYERPIMNGMTADCSPTEKAAHEKLSSELHGILSSIVHRCGKDVLRKALPFKQEAVIHIRQSKPQTKLYREFSKYKKAHSVPFWEQYHALRPISNHPACLSFFRDQGSRSASPIPLDSGINPRDQPSHAPKEYAWFCDKCKVAKFDTLEDAVDHEATCQEVPAANDCGNKEWWKTFYDNVMKSGLDIKAIEYGGKVIVLLQILAHCDTIGDKVVVFSQCLKTLGYIEEILQSSDWGGFLPYLPGSRKKFGGWKLNSEYSRIDGSVDANTRGELISTFNSVEHSKVFLVSTLAGGLGINLIAANRVVLIDTHWNPAISDQAVHRCYRIGQNKPVYCYRLLAEGTMEEKIFSRAATKTSLSDLVIDAKNIDRLFSRREMDLLQEYDNWVMCESCKKWRMLCPDGPDDEVNNLPEMWYCKDNIHDPERSVCDAPEQDTQWYAQYWESRRKEHEGSTLTPFLATRNNKSLEKFAKRDVVLQTLLARTEGTTRGSAPQSTNSWISKYSFSKETVQAADELDAKDSANKVESSSPKKTTTKKNRGSNADETKKGTRASPRKSDAATITEEKTGKNQVASLRENSSDSTAGQDVSPMQGRIPRKTATPGSSRQTFSGRDSSGSDRNSRRKSAPVGLPEHRPKRVGLKGQPSWQANGQPSSRQNRKSMPTQSCLTNEMIAAGNKRKPLRALTPSATKIPKSNLEVKVPPEDHETIDLCLDSDSD